MNAILRTFLALALTGGTALAEAPHSNMVHMERSGRICLRIDHIQNRNIPDDRTIVFRMDDGTAWKNTLQNPCTGLRIADRFAFVNPPQWICANQQRIRVSGGAGGYCFLGEFTRSEYPPKPE